MLPGRLFVRAITAESIYHCMLLFLDHILYRRAHFVRDARSASRAVLAISCCSISWLYRDSEISVLQCPVSGLFVVFFSTFSQPMQIILFFFRNKFNFSLPSTCFQNFRNGKVDYYFRFRSSNEYLFCQKGIILTHHCLQFLSYDSIQRRLIVDATSCWRCIDVEAALYKHYVPAGLFQTITSS